jgi:hypothetical protein
MTTQSQLEVKELTPPTSKTTTGSGTGVDLQGYINPGGRQMKAFLSLGTLSGGTTPSLAAKLQESDTAGSGYTDITGATFTTLTAAGSQEIHFKTTKRYVRVDYTITGTPTTCIFAAHLLAEKRFK